MLFPCSFRAKSGSTGLDFAPTTRVAKASDSRKRATERGRDSQDEPNEKWV